ncbi:MAG: hypothetical protein HYU66_07635 [Armatimonadetes bacterium]|nr:hypothetical protein [Armatimonadota bacterium]
MEDAEPVPGQVDLAGGDLFAWTPPWVERYLPGVGATFVHGYTGADAAKWKRAARNLALGGEPTFEQYQVAQVLWVCRTEPNGDVPTFRVDLQNARAVFEAMMERLPGKWVEQACLDSDMLTLDGYYPPPDPARQQAVEAARVRLGEQLADPEFWNALSVLSLKLYGVPLAENGRPLGEFVSQLHLGPAGPTLVDAIGLLR